MRMRVVAMLAVALATNWTSANAQTSATQAPDPQETRFGGEWRLEREDLAKGCGSLKTFTSCVQTLVTDHPFHIGLGSIAPQNGFGAGPAVVTHFTPKNWRITWSGDAAFAPGGAWRGGTYIKIFRTRIEPPRLAPAGERARPLRITEYPVYNIYAQAISLPKLFYYGLGPDTPAGDKTAYGMTETIVGGNTALPLNKVATPLRLSLLLEGNGRLFNVRDGTTTDAPSIGTKFNDATAPGLTTDPSFAQFGEGVRLRPFLFNDVLQLGYTFSYQQFVSTESLSSFQRWTVDLNHLIPLYHSGGGPALRDEQNTPNECTISQSVHACPSVTRDRWGSINLRAFASKSQVSGNAAVPFYVQQTLGGSDLNGERALASYDDFRFRGPHLLLFQESVEHALWGPIGALLLLEQGTVEPQAAQLNFHDLKHSVGVGMTIRAGGFPALNASWHTGGPEGHHFIFTLDTSLLGGGSRPLLQ